ncbi:MAG: tail sheath stabilizer and completion protein, partial [Candidatus Poseidoniales archaeon]
SFAYDNTRQLTKLSTFKATGTTNDQRQKFYSPVPYNINFDLNIYAKNQDDALQIVEQILPTFNPQYTLTIKPFPTEYPNFKEDIPIIIQGLTFSDDFEGAMESRRTIIYTLSFEMKVSFYGAIAESDVIRTSIARLFETNAGAGGDSDIKLETITVTPNPTTIIGLPDSDFGFDTTIELAKDSV